MKKNLFLTGLVICVLMFGCQKSSTPSTNTVTQMFWLSQSGNQISVTVDGTITGVVSGYYAQTTAPACGSAGCFSLSVVSGTTHSFTATDGVHTWSGTFNDTAGCSATLLKY